MKVGFRILPSSPTDDPSIPPLSAPPSPTENSFKRHRLWADVDGDDTHLVQKKKRRLRLNLITSRLSRPFATPSTYILNRANSRIAKWSQQKTLGGNFLRKAAIMNWMRIKLAIASNVTSSRLLGTGMVLAQETSLQKPPPTVVIDGAHNTLPDSSIASLKHQPHSPSILGLSNYDLFDLEDDAFQDEEGDECDVLEEGLSTSKLRETGIIEAIDASSNNNRSSGVEDRSTSKMPHFVYAEDLLNFVRKAEIDNEVSFAQFQA